MATEKKVTLRVVNSHLFQQLHILLCGVKRLKRYHYKVHVAKQYVYVVKLSWMFQGGDRDKSPGNVCRY